MSGYLAFNGGGFGGAAMVNVETINLGWSSRTTWLGLV